MASKRRDLWTRGFDDAISGKLALSSAKSYLEGWRMGQSTPLRGGAARDQAIAAIRSKGPARGRSRSHATMKAESAAKSETRLPNAGARETKKNAAVMKAFNSKVEGLLDKAGAKLRHELSPDHREFVLETKAGPLFVTPLGNWVATRFEDPEAAAKLVGTYNLNTYSGKWNHNYFDWPVNEAFRDVAHWLKQVAP